MQISWFEIIAQIINFFIILVLLQKLLYKPVINAMEKRQERIQKSQIEADEKMTKAKELISEYDLKIASVEDDKKEILDSARKDAQEKRLNLLEQYKDEAENKRKAYLKEIEDEKEVFISNLRRNLGENAIKIASFILDTISSKELEEEVFRIFTDNLKVLKDNIPDKKIMEEESHLEIISSRDLSDKEKQTVQEILNTQMENLTEINYEIDSKLILGYELNLETYTVHTNIENYLDNIEKEIMSLL